MYVDKGKVKCLATGLEMALEWRVLERAAVETGSLFDDCAVFLHIGKLVAPNVRIGTRSGDTVDLGQQGVHDGSGG